MNKKILTIILIICLIFSINTTVFAQNDTVEDWTASVVRIVSYDSNGDPYATGSAFPIGTKEPVQYFITNSHVVTVNGVLAKIQILRSKDDLVDAKTVIDLPLSDIAVVKASSPLYGYEPFVLCEDENVTVGDPSYALGFPGASITDDFFDSYSSDVSITKGIISKKTESDGIRVFQTDTPVSSGNSGGPLLNEDYQVIGINSFVMPNAGMDINGSVYINYVTDLLISRGIKYLSSEDVKSNTSSDNGAASDANSASDAATIQQSPTPAPVTPTPATPVPLAPKSEPKSNNMLIIVIVAAVLLLVIIGVIIMLMRKKPVSAGLIMGSNLVMPFEVTGEPVVIGRDAAVCQIVDNGEKISRQHCSVSFVEGGFMLTDLSSNGTFLADGTQLQKGQAHRLNHGDSFYLADGTHSYQLSNKQ
jgi:S1-C subfamily serine protease